CSRIYNDYDGVTHDYTRKRGLIYEQVFLPEHAPKEWSDRSILWNAVEEAEKTKDSRLSRELVIALPVEFDLSVWERMLQEYIKCNFVNRGMCADLCIHDTDGHNPHAHIMLTVRPLNKDGTWQRKTEKEYLCVRNGEERGFTASEYKVAQKNGWEKQYLYKIGKKKEYLPPSKAERLERVNKYPKSTKYGRQNPISEAWNSEETLLEWRERWASLVNSYFKEFEMDESIDHRSFLARGIKKQPTVHVGVSGFAIVKKKRYCDRYELNRLIRQDNQFIDDIVKTIEYLVKTIALAVSAIADALEVARVELICLKYRERHLNIAHTTGKYYNEYYKERLKAYHALTEQIEQKTNERNEAIKESKRFFLKADRRTELTKSISNLTNELEDLESRRNMLLEYLKCKSTDELPQAEARIKETENNLPKIQAEWDKTDEALDEAIAEYGKLKAKASDFDKDELNQARKSLRTDKESEARKKIHEEHGRCDDNDFADSKEYIDKRIGEYDDPPQIEAEIKPVYEAPSQEAKDSKAPSKSQRERDGWDR
ncbi:MAG: MobA/MobL family protein, partial [Clostridia bacterium]|nr:MobA/MobL family protein [Clostridia bacterium]